MRRMHACMHAGKARRGRGCVRLLAQRREYLFPLLLAYAWRRRGRRRPRGCPCVRRRESYVSTFRVCWAGWACVQRGFQISGNCEIKLRADNRNRVTTWTIPGQENDTASAVVTKASHDIHIYAYVTTPATMKNSLCWQPIWQLIGCCVSPRNLRAHNPEPHMQH